MCNGFCFGSSQRDYVTKKLSDVEEGLSNARANKRQTERDKRIAEAAAMLKRDVPGGSNLQL